MLERNDAGSFMVSLLNLSPDNYGKLIIPLAGVALIVAFLLILIVNYFIHMRRNGFFKLLKHKNQRQRFSNAQVVKTSIGSRSKFFQNLSNLKFIQFYIFF